MMEIETSRRKRTENFSKSEEKFLIESVKKFTNIIECKKTDAVSIKEKNAAWIKVANWFNSNSQNYRAADQLKTKYLNLKKQCKKDFAEEKQIKIGTGGGPFSTLKTSTVDEDIREILGSQVTGMRSNFDNDLDENAPENVLDQGIQSEVILESHNNEDNIEYYEITEEINEKSTVSGNLKENRGRPDPLKQKLGKWAESKSNLEDFQIKCYEEEHKKKMDHLEKKKCIRAPAHEIRT
ncbi:unnamed protein product [Ceutorhynchus assimilis]|uniref:Regulatory protein zeste n=1 Tax=Ceutorhynchus assimilis TaxID=467358 RepID=A0A9N9N1T4_9CUCU|nr:unnamed protein product [Ceutorhynchus assimilis]